MRLYNEIQELLRVNEENKQAQNNVLSLARNELVELVKSESNKAKDENKSALLATLNPMLKDEVKKLKLKDEVKKLVSSSLDSKRIESAILNTLLEKFNTIEIERELKKQLRDRMLNEIEELLNKESLQEMIALERDEMKAGLKQENLSALRGFVTSYLNNHTEEIIKSVLKNMDFGFLKSQSKLFYPMIKDNLKALFLEELESEFLQNYILEVSSKLFDKVKKLEELKKIELKASFYLQSVLETNKVKLLQDALNLVERELLREVELKNALAYEKKKAELIKEGKLESEILKNKRYKGE
ncbi:hypothetical protein [Helicobacter cetorum]|uniref:Uncharacterized protein n=1 Tax=Helicobacter cetorum (strain ATCC BAA-429 / MIT 00-7128) TaxID=182217 RepID=I0ELP0_HELC0|nr:hypothetical protein [Helicobacter cetorum]AFI03859.1 hypothetical protein HCW_02890 [Helicobacter cetorum MIT 00-7128]